MKAYSRKIGSDIDEFKEVNIKQKPKDELELQSRVIEYGSFASGLKYLMDSVLSSSGEKSVIITGNPGSGRRTLIRLAQSKKNLITVHLSPYAFSTDFSAIDFILNKLGLKMGDTLSDIMNAMEKGRFVSEKVMVVLLFFEEFCRSKQSLLYNLTQMIQFGFNMCLIGVSSSRDCTQHLEKRVRSRLSASFYELKPPYNDFEEYLKFASLLLGGYKFPDLIEEELKCVYNQGCRSVSNLKRVLMRFSGDLLKWNKVKINGSMKGSECLYSEKSQLLNRKFRRLTPGQVDKLMMAARYCKSHNCCNFQLGALARWVTNYGITFKIETDECITDIARLVRSGLMLAKKKKENAITEFSEFSLMVHLDDIKYVVDTSKELQNIRSNALWLRLR